MITKENFSVLLKSSFKELELHNEISKICSIDEKVTDLYVEVLKYLLALTEIEGDIELPPSVSLL